MCKKRGMVSVTEPHHSHPPDLGNTGQQTQRMFSAQHPPPWLCQGTCRATHITTSGRAATSRAPSFPSHMCAAAY